MAAVTHEYNFPVNEIGAEIREPGPYGFFFGDLVVRYVDGRTWVVLNDSRTFGYTLPDGRVVAPAHEYVTDMASIPKVARGLFPQAGDGKGAIYGPAAVIHDWLYRTQNIEGKEITRSLADKVMLWAMQALKVAPWRQRIIYAAIRLAGWIRWKRLG